MIQLQCINYLLESKDSSFITLNNLTPEYFSDYTDEFTFIKNHLDQYNTIPDKETFLNKFSSFELIQVKENPEYLIKELFEDYNTRFIANTFNKIRSLLIEDKIDDAINLYKNASNNITKGEVLKSVDILKDVSRYNDYVERTKDFGKYYVSTGFPELDKIIGGWDREEELATISARTGVGKSWCIIKMAVAAAQQGLNVGLYSGEMSERKVGYRVDTMLGHIPNGSLIHGNENVINLYKQYIDELPTKLTGSLKVLTPLMINGPATVSALRTFIEKENIDILFIDQHSLLEDERKAKNPVEKAANISKDLKILQVLKKIPIISISQQNRSSTENGVDASHIAQSDRIAQDSTVIIFLEKKDDILTMHLAKSRDSENMKDLKYQVDWNLGNFTYIPTENDALKGEESAEYEHRYDVEPAEGENVF